VRERERETGMENESVLSATCGIGLPGEAVRRERENLILLLFLFCGG
jgi:hypothetical protein